MITKLQQGGQMEQQLVQLVQAAMSGDQKATQQIDKIMQAAQQGDQQAIQIANYIQKIAKQLQGSIKAKLGAKLNYYKYLKQGGPLKYQKGGWIDKKKGIWNWDSLDRMDRVKNYYLGKADISRKDWNYVYSNPELESFLHNVYKNSKLPNVRTAVSEDQQKYTNNFPRGAKPDVKIVSVPDSTNNYKGRIGIGKFVMQPKQNQPPKQTPKQTYKQSYGVNSSSNNTQNYMFGATDNFEDMVSREHSSLFDSNWKKDIKTWKDPRSGKSYRYVTIDGINYLDNGRYWNPQTKQGGNYSWKPGWRLFGGGFIYY